MMAKMFYTMEETKSALGRGEEEIKQFARDGRLREFRDGPRLMFKADQVEQARTGADAFEIDLVLDARTDGGLGGRVNAAVAVIQIEDVDARAR